MIQHTFARRSGPRLVALCLALLIMALGVMTAAAAPTCTTTCYVDAVNGDDTNDGTTAGTALKTIQAAVNQVTAGGQVFALTGTFPEQVTVNKSVTITGDGPTLTIIDPPPAGNGLNISVGDVTIEDLRVTDAAQGARISGTVANITFDNVTFISNASRGIDVSSGAVISNVQLLNSLFDNVNIGMRMASGAIADGITINNTTFQNNAGSGFNQANDGSAIGRVTNLTVTDSTFTNNGTTSGHAGVYAEEFSNVLIEDSTFTGNQYGINLWDVYSAAPSTTTNVVIRNNTFANHKWSTIALQSTTSDPLNQLFLVEGNTITQDVGALVGTAQAHIAVTTSSANPNGAVDVVDNTLTFSGTFPTPVKATYGLYIAGGSQDVHVEGNALDGGNVGTNGATIPTSGIRIATNIFQTNANIVAIKNTVNNFDNGVSIYSGSTPGGVQPDANIDINRNDLDGNTVAGIQSGPSTETDGTCNWWGDVSGPSGAGPGSGSAVSTYVDYMPWLYTDDLDGPCYIGGTITVVKEAGDVGEQFEFDPSWSDDNFSLYSGGSETSDPLPAGTYSVEEVNLPPGWSLESASCVNEGGPLTPVNPVDPSSIPVEDYDAWVCTFTNVYTPPSSNICPAEGASNLYTDIIGQGMGSVKKHKTQLKLNVPNWMNVDSMYGQMVAKDFGKANYVRFYLPGKNNYVQVNTITSPIDHTGGNFWYGAYLDPAQYVKGRWFLQKSGTKGHIPRAFLLYPTYADPNNTYVNVWDTYDASEGEVYWDTAGGWTAVREITVPIAPPNGSTTFHVELAVADNDKDNRRVWVTVTAGGVTQSVSPNNPDSGDLLNLLTFDLPGVPAGTDEIVIEIASYQGDGAFGDSASLVGMAAHYECGPLD